MSADSFIDPDDMFEPDLELADYIDLLGETKRGRPLCVWTVVDVDGSLLFFEGAAKCAKFLGCARQTLYNLASKGLPVKGLTVRRVAKDAAAKSGNTL